MVDFHDQPDSDDSSSDDSSSDDSGSDDSGSDDELIHNFLQQNPHLAQALLKHHNGSIRLLLRKFIRSIDIKAIIRYLSSPEFRSALLKGVWNHKGKILFGIFLMCNPLAMTGFGVLGPTAGSIAAAVQSFIGNVVSGSAFAILQSIGMTWGPIAFAAVGGTVIGYAGGKVLWNAVGDPLKLWWRGLWGTGDGDGDGHVHAD